MEFPARLMLFIEYDPPGERVTCAPPERAMLPYVPGPRIKFPATPLHIVTLRPRELQVLFFVI